MSLQAMVYVIYRSTAKGMAKYVQLLIADFVDADTGQAGPPGPSVEVLARNGGVGKATVLRQVEKLTTLGELLVQRGSRGAGNTHVYSFPRFQGQQAERSAPDQDGRPGAPVDNSAGRGRERSAKGPQKVRSVVRYMDDPDPDPHRARAREDPPRPPTTHGRNAGHADDGENCPACGTGRYHPAATTRRIGALPS